MSPHAFPVVQTLQQPSVELEQDVVAEVKSNGSSKTGSSNKALDTFACCFLIIMFLPRSPVYLGSITMSSGQ